MWVVKLGGSLAGTTSLQSWIDTLAPLPVVIVPGGGPFADTVRRTQQQWHFSEQTAHDMAITAMAQFGRMLADLGGNLPTFTRLGERPPSPVARATVWLPCPEALTCIPPSWDITSDSIAAWLAGALAATDLLLVKAALGGGMDDRHQGKKSSADTWVREQLVDPAFPGYSRSIPTRCWLCGTQSYRHLTAALKEPESFFVAMTKSDPRAP